jgi:hypothetical protein
LTNRIQILNWRQHGDDESYCLFAAYGADDPTFASEEIEQEIDPDYDWNQDTMPEEREDWEHVYYVNDDITIKDGEVVLHNGRKFRITITEVY